MTIHLLWSNLYLLLYVIPVLYGSGCQGKIGRKVLHDTLNNSDVVLTATVKNITIDAKDNQIKSFSLRVRRIFKGKEYLDGNRHIQVISMGPILCDRLLSVRSTRVFSMSATGDHLVLVTPILPVSLAILDALHSFSIGIPHKKRRRAKEAPCETNLCPFGSKCSHSTGKCECRHECRPTAVQSTVCGSDHVSYASHCHLSVRSCLLQKQGRSPLKVLHYGNCEKKNPCDELRCGPGEECVVTQKDGLLTADCICPKECPNYGDSVYSSPVCSSEGVDYPSVCHMKQHACAIKSNITVRYYGKCDPCANFTCPQSTSCHLGSNRKPECRCSEVCPLTYNPVCATDGKTYSNECVMRVSACKEETNLAVWKKGKCEATSPCAALECSHGAECVISQDDGSAQCKCPENCPAIMKPVCATNGITYDNECELKRAACLDKSRIAVKHEKTCGKGVCASFTGCRPPQVCVNVDGKPECACPQCGDELREVCGSDGRTYPNECKMRRSACLSSKLLFVKYNGICEGCESMKCEFYSSCVSDSRGKGECKCPSDCMTANKDKSSLVCGTDGVTYSSECHLRRSACQQKKFIVVAFTGKCDACLQVECRYGEECRGGVCVCSYNCPSNPPSSARVCGENGVLYPSECHLQLASCQKGAPIAEMPPAHCHSAVATFEATRYRCSPTNCRYGGVCRGEQCICNIHCLERNYPLCGSDGNIYHHQCHMNMVACREQRDIHVLPRLSICQQSLGNDSCLCNRVGSYGPTCDAHGQCKCRPGVGGKKCDHCLPNFWGIHLIANGAMSCQPCGCSAFGAARPDCEQTTGRCECQRGAIGEKCNKCASDHVMTPSGCVSKDEYRSPTRCADLRCHHGSTCVQPTGGLPDCHCTDQCDVFHLGIAANMTVCGSDGVTYDSHCQLQQFACRHQLDLVVVSLGICENGEEEVQERSEREGKLQLGSHCTVPSDCDELNAICLTRPGRRGVCECGDDAQRVDDRCERIQAGASVRFLINSPENGILDLPRIVMYSNISFKLTPLSLTGSVLSGITEDNEEFGVKLENGRIVVELGDDSIYARDAVPLNETTNFDLRWKGKVASLQTDTEKITTRVETVNSAMKYIKIGGKRPLQGAVEDLVINNVTVIPSPPRSLQSTPTPSTVETVPEEGSIFSALTVKHDGFLEFPAVKRDVRNVVEVEIRLKPISTDGLVFFWGTVEGGKATGDFLALYLVASQPHFFWNLGSGISYVKAPPISSQQWSTIVFSRQLKNGSITVNGKDGGQLESQGKNVHLDVAGQSVYVGGIAGRQMIPDRMGKLSHHFEGTIGYVAINEEPLELSLAKRHGSVKAYESSRCKSDPCPAKGSQCYERTDGRRCRDKEIYPIISLSSDAAVEYAYLNNVNTSQIATNETMVSFEFRAKTASGVIWYETTWRQREDGDFFVIFLDDEELKVAVNLGNDLFFKAVTIPGVVELNKWHTVNVERIGRIINVQLDGRPAVSIVTTPGSQELNTNGIIYLGGRLQPKRGVLSQLPGRFDGCLREVFINGNKLNLVHDTVSEATPLLCHF